MPNRHRFRFTTRLVLGLVTLVALALAYPASIVRQSAYEHSVVARLPRGAHVEWTPTGPKWLRNLVGEERCRVVKRLGISGAVPKNLDEFRKLSALEDLAIRSCDLGDAHLERLGVLPHVHRLDLRRTTITDRSVDMLIQHPLLAFGQFERTQLSPAGLKRLHEEGRIVFIRDVRRGEPWSPNSPYLPNSELVAAGFPAVELPAPSIGVPEAVPEDLFQDSQPNSFRLVGIGYTDRYLEKHPLPMRTRGLTLDSTAVTSKGVALIARLPNLESLTLMKNELDDDALAALAGHPRLKHLVIEERNITAAGVKHLVSLPQLRFLFIDGPGIRNEAAQALGGCRQLEYLNLHTQNITSDCLPALGKLTALKQLSLGGTNISNRHLDELAKLPQLERLNLRGTFVNGNGARELAPLKKLTYLELGCQQVPPDDQAEVRGRLPKVDVRFR